MTHPRGRLTNAQRRGIQEVLPSYLLTEAASEVSQLFGRDAPLGVEIGFGMGDALCHWATSRPDWNLLGIDIYVPGIGALANRLHLSGLSNIRIAQGRAEEVVDTCLLPSSVDEFRIFFPDPWPKKRHHKRRLIQPLFARALADRLKPGGRLWFVTDWAPYAEWAGEIFSQLDELSPDAGADVLLASRPETKFERRGLRLGNTISELVYQRT